MSDCKAAVVQQKSSKVASSLAPPAKFLLSANQTSLNRRRAQRAFPAAARPMACHKRQKTKTKMKINKQKPSVLSLLQPDPWPSGKGRY